MYRLYFKFNSSDKCIIVKEIPNNDIGALTKHLADLMGNNYNLYFTDIDGADHIIRSTELLYISIEKHKHSNP